MKFSDFYDLFEIILGFLQLAAYKDFSLFPSNWAFKRHQICFYFIEFLIKEVQKCCIKMAAKMKAEHKSFKSTKRCCYILFVLLKIEEKNSNKKHIKVVLQEMNIQF